ncbi:uridine diphosphate-N-acetylglucosamine-binding protein YvcK [Actinomycetospora chlora]|uniref:Putative gluconeogenesis factor n=1 Tax=Actinomycetospora chlora TaxID=663608 RepID=A0ABP9BDB7_9PSEU
MTGARPLKAVALGGGHGLHATLSALRRLTDDITAIVVVADDGGSSGRIRRELDILPLGDLRMALGALAGQENAGPENTLWQRLFEHRYGGHGALAGHAVGNLVLAGLLEVLDDPVAALDQACHLLGVTGRVLPMSPQPVDIEADVTGIRGPGGGDQGRDVAHRIRGQVAVATTPGKVQQVRLDPRRPKACPEACAALREADLVTLGPGSWFSSVLPHLLVPEQFAALSESEARKVLVLNLAPQPGETAGFSPEQHLEVLAAHAPRLRLDVVVADTAAVPEPDRLRRGAEAFGADTLLTTVGTPDGSARHDPDALAEALADAAHLRAPHRDGAAPGPGTNGVAVPGADPARDGAREPARPHQEEDRRWP